MPAPARCESIKHTKKAHTGKRRVRFTPKKNIEKSSRPPVPLKVGDKCEVLWQVADRQGNPTKLMQWCPVVIAEIKSGGYSVYTQKGGPNSSLWDYPFTGKFRGRF